jgi:hypothetical protein
MAYDETQGTRQIAALQNEVISHMRPESWDLALRGIDALLALKPDFESIRPVWLQAREAQQRESILRRCEALNIPVPGDLGR